MTNYLGFIDETGVLHNDPNQRFFGIGLLKCEDTSVLYEELYALKSRAESKFALINQQKGLPPPKGGFEFKYNAINNSSVDFYYELISLYFKFAGLKFCSLVLDKANPNIKVGDIFLDTWEAYISYSKLLIKNNLSRGENICIIADFLGRPKSSNKYYGPEIKSLENVYNATVLESHASLFIQLVDVLAGCVVCDFRRTRQSAMPVNACKAKVCDFLKTKLGVSSLAGNATVYKPNYFSVWEFKPQ